MKTIGISEEVYKQLLQTKHEFEKKEGIILSYDKIIMRLIKKNGESGDNKPIISDQKQEEVEQKRCAEQ